MSIFEKPNEGAPPHGELLPQASDIPAEIQEKLKKHGLEMSSDTFQQIGKAGKIDSMLADLSAVEWNPGDRGRFETMYIKGFGQVVTINGRTLTFLAISQLPREERSAVLKELGRLDPDGFEEVNDFIEKLANQRVEEKKSIEQAANQEESKIDGNIRAANQRIEEKKSIEQAANQEESKIDGNIRAANQRVEEWNKTLKPHNEEVQQINGVPKPNIEELRQKAKEGNLELKGGIKLNSEVIDRGYVDEILKSNFYIQKSQEIEAKLNPRDADRFRQSVNSMRVTLGMPVDATESNVKRLTGAVVLGPDRDRIENQAQSIAREGKYETVRWDERSRSLVFENKFGDTRIIETASIPPRERIVRSGLSISRDIKPISPEAKARKGVEEAYTRNQEMYQKGLEQVWITRRGEYENSSLYSEFLGDNRLLQLQYERDEQKIAQGEISIKDQPATISDMIRYTEEMRSKNAQRLLDGDTRDSIGTINAMLEKRIQSLQKFKIQSENMLQAEKNSAMLPKERTETRFEDIARSNLSWLTDDIQGFHKLGSTSQVVLDEVINTINLTRDTASTRIDLSRKEIDDIDKEAIRARYAKLIQNLGYDKSILTSAEIGVFQRRLSEITSKDGNPIRELLEEPKSQAS